METMRFSETSDAYLQRPEIRLRRAAKAEGVEIAVSFEHGGSVVVVSAETDPLTLQRIINAAT